MKFIYVVFSNTPTGLGKIIRTVTKNEYNHIALSFYEDLRVLYSFARRHKKAPFYGGLVEESPLRYKNSKVKICKIPLTEEQFEKLENEVNSKLENKENYIYNFFSAFVFPFKKNVKVANAFTCVEFIVYLFSLCKILGIENRFYSIYELEFIFDKYVVFSGRPNFVDTASWGNDSYNFNIPYFKSVAVTIKNFFRLARRFCNGCKKNN